MRLFIMSCPAEDGAARLEGPGFRVIGRTDGLLVGAVRCEANAGPPKLCRTISPGL